MECVLADVDADRADGFQCILRCALRMLLALCASRSQSSGYTAERGRASKRSYSINSRASSEDGI
jgi:hypothetical protein